MPSSEPAMTLVPLFGHPFWICFHSYAVFLTLKLRKRSLGCQERTEYLSLLPHI